jgi:P4 family phage/plasmid primase-like protien
MKIPKEVTRALERGWSIMPLRLDKKPFLKQWKYLQTRRPTIEDVTNWQAQFNPPAWGLICGAISGVVVVDLDDYTPGTEGLSEKLKLAGKEHVRTGSGGKHLYFVHPGFHVPTLNSKSAKKIEAAGYKGFDIRGDGGYVVFHGRNETGAYKWLRKLEDDLTVDLLPADLRTACDIWPAAPAAEEPAAPAAAPARSSAPKGRKKAFDQWALDEALTRQSNGRNAAGFWLAQQLRDEGWSQGDTERFIVSQYQPRTKDTDAKGQRAPYTAEEARASVAAAFSRPRRERLTTKAEQADADRAEADRQRAQFQRNADEARRRNEAPRPADPPTPFDDPDDEAPAEPSEEFRDMVAASIGAATAAAAHTAAATAPARALAEAPSPPPDPEDENTIGAWEPGSRQTGAYKCKLDDIGNAERFVMQQRGNVRYCATMTKWFLWDGKRMRLDDTEQVYYLASKTARSLWDEIKHANGETDRDARIAHAKKSGGNERLNAMVTIARRLPSVPVRSTEIDAHPWLVNVANGTLDLRKIGTGKELQPHKREHFITKLIPTHYLPGAQCPEWMKFLNLIMGGNQNLIRYLQICVGYCLSGDISERALFIPWGNGANGKSTFLITVQELLSEYAMKTPASTLVNRKEHGIPNDIARLQGARFVYASETKDGCKLSEDTVKELTGGEPLTARFMRGEFFEFLPNFKLWLATNHRPVIGGTDKGIWDRIKLIPFIVRIPDVVPEDEQVSREIVLDRFRREMQGILSWAVEGARMYVAAGRIPEPPEVTAATSAYREDMDTLAHFLEEYTQHTQSPDFTVRAGVLYECFKVWAKENGEYEISQKVFSNRILERGYIRKKTPAGKVFLNLKLRKIPEQLRCTIMQGDERFSDIDPHEGEAPAVMPKNGTQPCMTRQQELEGVEI